MAYELTMPAMLNVFDGAPKVMLHCAAASDAKAKGTCCLPHKAMSPCISSDTAPDVGKWYAVSYKNLKKDSVSLSGAFKLGGKTSTETFKEAIQEFTVENGYFDYYSECTKSE